MSDTTTAEATPETAETPDTPETQAPETETTGAQVPGEVKLPGNGNGDVPAAVKAAAETVRKFKLKYGEEEVELDEPELIRRAQLGFGAEKRLQEAAQANKKAMKVLEEWNQLTSLIKDPRKAFEIFRHPSIGLDPEKIAEDLIYEKIQREQMTPEQKEAAELKARLMRLEDEKKAQEQEAQTQQMKALEEKYTNDYQSKIISTLEKAGLPKNRRTVARMANYMLAGLQEGVELDPSDVIELVRKDYLEDIQGLFGQLEGDKLLEVLGEDVAKKIRATDLARIKGKAKDPQAKNEPPPKVEKKKMTKEDWREYMERQASA